MTSIVLVGAQGAIGRRAVSALADHPAVDRLVLVDRDRIDTIDAPEGTTIEYARVDLAVDDLDQPLQGADVVAHLATSFTGAHDGHDTADRDNAIAGALLEAAERTEVSHVVLVSSAMVYGAWPDNPMPLTEDALVRPVSELPFAVAKATQERLVTDWCQARPGRSATLLRPTVALAEQGAGWVARALRRAAGLASGDTDPPHQFVHLDDVASAVALACVARLDGAFNVAPDGWISPERMRELAGGAPRLRVAEGVADQWARVRFGLGLTSDHPALVPYASWSWVVANDRLRSAGWKPGFSNEEAYVAGSNPAPWDEVTPQRRQELALGAATVGGAATVLALVQVWRRWLRG
ncbi:MAG: NAD-dependent epimerase/dehydratase family protein [Actinomycetia bacterium]|nr:NAD-dependent epimerase/dehydratase family protein [Actinomycetes bacterium]